MVLADPDSRRMNGRALKGGRISMGMLLVLVVGALEVEDEFQG